MNNSGLSKVCKEAVVTWSYSEHFHEMMLALFVMGDSLKMCKNGWVIIQACFNVAHLVRYIYV